MISLADLLIWSQLTFVTVVVGGAFAAVQFNKWLGPFSYELNQTIGRSILAVAVMATFVVARVTWRVIYPPAQETDRVPDPIR